MVTVELLYRPNWNINLFFKKFKVERNNSGCLEDYISTALSKELKRRYPSKSQRLIQYIFESTEYSNEKKEIEENIGTQMKILISHNGLTRMSNNYCEDILVNYLDNENFKNQVTNLSSQFKEKFDVSLMGNITFFNDRFKDEYKIMEDNYGI